MIALLAISPLEASFAAVSSCSDMLHDMSAVMHQSSSNERVAANPMTHDCCTQHDCATAHCYASVVAVVLSVNLTESEYLVDTILQLQNQSLESAYSATIFRPPRS